MSTSQRVSRGFHRLGRMFIKQVVAAGALAVMLTGGAAAGSVDDGGAAYMSGDYATALQLFQPQAEQGDPYAQTMLGNMYDAGEGVPQDFVEAVRWYRLAAEQGFPQGQENLGAMYLEGRGVPKSYVEAYKWSNLAASRFPKDNGWRVTADKTRDLAASKLTPAQIDKAQRLAREWKPKPAAHP
jgi:TPR repeat protein